MRQLSVCVVIQMCIILPAPSIFTRSKVSPALTSALEEIFQPARTPHPHLPSPDRSHRQPRRSFSGLMDLVLKSPEGGDAAEVWIGH